MLQPPLPSALSAEWPQAVLELSDEQRKAQVRRGQDTVLLDCTDENGERQTRGFLKVVLRVPLLAEPDAGAGQVFGTFVEVDREVYLQLKKAFHDKTEVRVQGRLANRLPLLEEAYGSAVEVIEDGSDRRARVVSAEHDLINRGPVVGP